MLELMFSLPQQYYKGARSGNPVNWIKTFSKTVIEHVVELDENKDQVIDIVKRMLVKKSENRLTA